MNEILQRIRELKDMRKEIVNSPQVANDLEAAVCFLDMSIAEHEADIQAAVTAWMVA